MDLKLENMFVHPRRSRRCSHETETQVRTEIVESLIAKTMCDSEGEKENVVGTREVK